jgi:hypothetical protein
MLRTLTLELELCDDFSREEVCRDGRASFADPSRVVDRAWLTHTDD